MIYPKYGQAFRSLRTQHHLSLSDFQYLGLSKSTLSNFENGKQMMAFDKVTSALQEMSVSLTDYNLLLNNSLPDDFISDFSKIERADYQNDLLTLARLHEERQNDPSQAAQFIALAAKACYRQLDKTEKAQLAAYFDQVTFWGYFELSILVNVIDQLEASQICRLLDYFWQTQALYQAIEDYRYLIARSVLKAVLAFIDKKDALQASQYLSRLKSTLLQTDLLNQLMLHFVEGYYCYTFNSEAAGKKQMQRSIRILGSLNLPDLKSYYLRYYKEKVH